MLFDEPMKEHSEYLAFFARFGTVLKAVSRRATYDAGASRRIGVSGQKSVGDYPALESGQRLFCVDRDHYATFRVDVTELFSRWLVGAGYRIDWLMERN